MTPTITAFATSPDRGQGLARDMRVRWALEEVKLDYDVQLVTFAEMKQPAHVARHPFGQIPTYEEGELTLFESGGIVFHLADHHPGLFPADEQARARVVTWMFSAVSTVEPPIVEREQAMLVERDKPWFAERNVMLDDRVRTRLKALSECLDDKDWLEGAFSAADVMMVLVLRRLGSSGILPEFPNLEAYVKRGEARPAYQRAFADQLAVFTALSAG